MRKNFVLISIIFLAISIIISSIIISYNIKEAIIYKTKEVIANKTETQEETLLISQEEAAKYIGISEKQLERLIEGQLRTKRGFKIPYIVLSRKRYFSKLELIKWVTLKMDIN